MPVLHQKIMGVLDNHGIDSQHVTQKSLRPSLSLERRRRSLQFHQHIGFFLEKVGQLQSSELEGDMIGQHSQQKPMFAGEHFYRAKRWRRLFADLEGEYFFESEDSEGGTFTHLILYQDGPSGPLFIDRRDTRFSRASFEKGIAAAIERRTAGEIDKAPIRTLAILMPTANAQTHYVHQYGPIEHYQPQWKVEEDKDQSKLALLFEPADAFSRLCDMQNLQLSQVNNIIKTRRPKYKPFSFYSDGDRVYSTDYARGAMESNAEANNRLIEAARADDLRGVITALIDGADINFQDEAGMTARHWAAHNFSVLGCEIAFYSEDESDELAQLLTSLESPERARKVLLDAAQNIDLLVRDHKGCYACTHVNLAVSYEESFKLSEKLLQQEYAASLRRREQYYIVPFRGAPGSPLGWDKAAYEQDEYTP